MATSLGALLSPAARARMRLSLGLYPENQQGLSTCARVRRPLNDLASVHDHADQMISFAFVMGKSPTIWQDEAVIYLMIGATFC